MNIEKENHHLKRAVKTLIEDYKQAKENNEEQLKCEKCNFVAISKTDFDNHIESNHKEKVNSIPTNFRFFSLTTTSEHNNYQNDTQDQQKK